MNQETIDRVQAYVSRMKDSHNHARDYKLTEYGLWRVWSCFPDSELGDVPSSHQNREVLEYAVGRFADILARAVNLPRFRIRHEDEKIHSMSKDPEPTTYDPQKDIGSANAGYIEKLDGHTFFTVVPKEGDADLENLIVQLEKVK